MEPFEFLYHSTNLKKSIVKSGILNENTHFCCTLLHGQVPSKLPYYGRFRIGIDVQTFIGNQFVDPQLYFVSSSKQRRTNHNIWYHNLLLTESYCLGLDELDITDNEFLIMDVEEEEYLVKQNNSGDVTWIRNRYIPEYHWVNVEVDAPIDLSFVDYWWD